MDKVLKYSGTLSLFYVTNKTPISQKMYSELEPFFAMLTVSTGIEDYISHYEISNTYPDIVMIDLDRHWKEGIAILESIRSINGSQMIVVLNQSYTSTQLFSLMTLKIMYALEKPFEFDDLYRVAFDASKELYDRRLKEAENTMLHQRIIELDHNIESRKYAQGTKDEFFASISHEIRTPINAVIGLSHILLEANLEEKYSNYIDKIQTSGNLILNIVNDILDFSKIEAGKLQLENVAFNINTILENASTMISFKAYEKNLDFSFNIDSSVPSLLKGDALRLSQVLINLLSNAVKFTSTGEIILSVNRLLQVEGHDILEFCVSDTGIGLSEVQISTLFKSFSQASTSTTREYGGTGLGLTISKQLVELMGGEIRVESKVGEGSSFIFTIATEVLSSELYSLSSTKLRDKKVLIIDKHYQSRASLERMLNYFSYEILEMPSIVNLIDIIENNIIDIIFFDKETLNDCNLSLLPSNYKGKVVVIHTNQEIQEDMGIDTLEVNAYLEKPCSPQRIVATLSKLFGEEQPKERKLHKKSLEALMGSRILLVEDNKINQAVIMALLEDTGIEVFIANNGEEAIALAKKEQSLDLILMDIEMPILNGYETSKALKKINSLSNIPIVALSGNTRQVDKDKSKEAGMVAHLSKPIHINNFYGALLEFIVTKRTLEERLGDATEEFKALLGVGKFVETLVLLRLLLEEAQEKACEEIVGKLKKIEDSILHYEKVFLVLLGNYEKAFKKFMKASERLEAKKDISNTDTLILNLENGILVYQSQEKYTEMIRDFSNTFRDSIYVLEERVKAFHFEEAIQLTFQIRREAIALELPFISNSIAPIVGIEKTQKRQLEEAIEDFLRAVKA
jgi:signal transduction histidine kinase/AmiR/NasT family two-component response regulator